MAEVRVQEGTCRNAHVAGTVQMDGVRCRQHLKSKLQQSVVCCKAMSQGHSNIARACCLQIALQYMILGVKLVYQTVQKIHKVYKSTNKLEQETLVTLEEINVQTTFILVFFNAIFSCYNAKNLHIILMFLQGDWRTFLTSTFLSISRRD